jgi:Cu(I)/Ag(I) efflux system periplasmic protein CusF
MNTPIRVLAIVLTTALASTAFAAGEHAGHGMAGSSSMAGHEMAKMSTAAMVDGVVKKVDKAAGKVTLQHGPLTNLDMPAMTMVFRLKDAARIDELRAGDKIRFVAENPGGVLTVAQFEKVM